MNVDTLLRPAAATGAEGLICARLLNEAAAGMYKMQFGRKYTDIIAAAFSAPGHDHSFQHFTVAERKGEIVGMLSGYTGEQHLHSDNSPLRSAAGWRRYRQSFYRWFAAPLFEFMDSIPEGDFYVHAIAVGSAHRNLGIGTLLLDSARRQARSAGSHRIMLDVAATNRDGRRFYERWGMTAETESPRWFGIPNTNVIRMVKLL